VHRWSDGSPAPVVDRRPPGVLLSVDLQERGRAGAATSRAATSRPSTWRAATSRSTATGPRFRPAPTAATWLEPEQFYIFATRERLRIPPGVCAELVAFDATKGELRTHYAGFIDSGFGWEDGRAPARRQARARDPHPRRAVPAGARAGAVPGRVLAQRGRHPDVLYGQQGSSYQMQGLRLAKQFT
jgi:deoxycytidine triphosphate deaminase